MDFSFRLTSYTPQGQLMTWARHSGQGITLLPECIHGHLSYYDVLQGNQGNCGYEVVGRAMGLTGQEVWSQVRQRLLAELTANQDRFRDMSQTYWYRPGIDWTVTIRSRIDHFQEPCGRRFEMEMPTMASLIANMAGVPFILYREPQELSLVCFPWNVFPTRDLMDQAIHVGMHPNGEVDSRGREGNHYVLLKPKRRTYPVPNWFWAPSFVTHLEHWVFVYTHHIAMWPSST